MWKTRPYKNVVTPTMTRLTPRECIAWYDSLAVTLYETQPVRVWDYRNGERNLTKDFYYVERHGLEPTISLSRNSRNEIWVHAEMPSVLAPMILRNSDFWQSSQREVRYKLLIEFEEQIEPARRQIMEIYARVR
jgi:hypothetical protein